MKSLSRGEKTRLSDLGVGSSFEVALSLSGPASYDLSCFGVDAGEKLSDDRYFVFYNQTSSPEGAIKILGAAGNPVRFGLDLSRLPEKIQKLVFVATIEGAGSMRDLREGVLEIFSGSSLARFAFSGRDFQDEKAVMVAEIYRKGEWRLGAVGQGFNGGLSALLAHFGGEEVKEMEPAPVKVSLTKVTLEKRGDRKVVNLQKGASNTLHVNLNWNATAAPTRRGLFGTGQASSPDLDLGCMYRLKDGSMGVIQALGGNFGARDHAPFILLDKDDRSGTVAEGENLYFYQPDLIDLVMVYAFIYQGTQDFQAVGGHATIYEPTGEIRIDLANPDPGRGFCAICTIRAAGSGVEVTKEERYFPSHREADQHYGFGFNWRAARK